MTPAEFLERHDAALIAQLTDPDGVTVDSVKVQRALEDAQGIIDGYTYRLAAQDVPPTATLTAHKARIALGLIAGNRAGEQFDSIRAGYQRSLSYLKSLAESDSKATDDVIFDAPAELFDSASLEAFGSFAPGDEQ